MDQDTKVFLNKLAKEMSRFKYPYDVDTEEEFFIHALGQVLEEALTASKLLIGK